MFPDCSIIIPAYNADRTIVAALDSLELSKIWKYQIEVIVIDYNKGVLQYAEII